MKLGYRKPSLSKSLKARTTGKLKRKVKRSINPYYGKKGTGWITNPKKAAYNKVYNKTTRSIFDDIKSPSPQVGNSDNEQRRTQHEAVSSSLSLDVIIYFILGLFLLFTFSGTLIGFLLMLFCFYKAVIKWSNNI